MNRRSFFKNLALSKDPIDIPQKAQINALEKFQGTWNKETRLHLLRRTMFGCTPAEYNSVETKSLDEILDILFATSSRYFAVPPTLKRAITCKTTN